MRRSQLAVVALEDRTTPVTVPNGFALSEFVGNLTQPTALQEAPDGRFFITQQQGTLRIALADGSSVTNALTLTVNSAGERGLLGLALDPNFSTNNFIYLYYTVPANGSTVLHNRVSRFTVTGNTINPASETILVDLDPLNPGASNHNGGALHFGNDGKLYVAVGDNASSATAQSLTSYFGKILRFNPDGTIPADNPATISNLGAPAGQYRAIYAAGLRNPFTFDVDPDSNRIYVNDVGQNTFEEINDLAAGRNFGWPGTEGDFAQSKFPNFTRPIVNYTHGGGNASGFAITGGAFYRPVNAQFPAEYDGDYFYADFVNNWIRRYDAASGQDSLFAFDLDNFSTVDLDAARDGRLLVLARGNGGTNDGSVFQISFTSAPQIVTPPADQTRQPGQGVTFSVVASGTAPLSYQWQRNNQNIPGETQASYTLANPQLADNGATFRAVVTNAGGSATSTAATLTVTTNQPPTPTILTPTNGTSFFAGQTINFSGSATDPEDGALPASAFSWRVDYITGSAPPRPFFPDTPGIASGSVTIPTRTPYTLPDVLYRFTLTVTDSVGNTSSTTRDIVPQTTTISLRGGNIDAATFTLDGSPLASPVTFVSVVGLERDIAAAITVPSGSQTFSFLRWFDGVTTASRTIVAPSFGTGFTALYVAVPPPPMTPPPPAPAPAVLVGSGTSPILRELTLESGEEVRRIDLTTLNLDPPFNGEARVTRGFLNGDSFPEFIVSSGPGSLPRVVILDGRDGTLISSALVFESTFTGGVFVAAGDIDGDGLADVIVSPDLGGGPRVRVFRNGDFNTLLADFFGIDDPAFRGGARVAAGDLNRDGRADLVVSAGFLGGPRIAGYDGLTLSSGEPTKIFNDFFAFEQTLRNGTFVAVGDIDGDGRGDLVTAAGPGGGPRVQAFSGADLLQSNSLATLANFFVGDSSNRIGVRVAFSRHVADENKLLVGTANGVKGEVFVYDRTALTPTGTPTPARTFTAFEEDFTGGVFVG